DLRCLEIVLEITQQRGFAFTKPHSTDAARRSGDQHPAQVGQDHGTANLNAFSTATERRRRHSQLCRYALIRAAAGAVASLIDRFRHAALAQQSLAKFAGATRLLVFPGADSKNAFEQPLKMKRTDFHMA